MNDTVSNSSPRRHIANASNAQHSTGPRTEAGKATSKLNALKSGLTGRTVLLPTDDVVRYEQHVAEWVAELKPVGPRESALVQSVADAHWRADRIVTLEFSLFAQGRVQFADLFAEQDAALQEQLIEAHIYLTYEKQLRNLSVQENRLRRGREKDMKELGDIQDKRRADEVDQPAKLKLVVKSPKPVNGFEFADRSTPAESEPASTQVAAHARTSGSRTDAEKVWAELRG